jgi:tRNA (cmo5U34)-methyltransferase
MLENKIRTPEEVEAYLRELKEWIAGEEETEAEEMSAFFTKRLARYEDVHLGNWGELYAHIADFLDGGLAWKSILRNNAAFVGRDDPGAPLIARYC